MITYFFSYSKSEYFWSASNGCPVYELKIFEVWMSKAEWSGIEIAQKCWFNLF